MEASAKDLNTGGRWAAGSGARKTRPVAPPWKPVPRSRRLGADDVHVVRSFLDLDPGELGELRTLLSPAEVERIDTLDASGACRATAARGLLRTLLGGYLGVEPRDVPLGSDGRGKPVLNGADSVADLHFNHARSGRLGVYAFTRAGPVGVDVERVRPVDEAEDDGFSSVERDTLRRLPPGLRNEGFYRCWTRKEALFKALGGQLPCPSLRDVDVSLTPGVPPRVYRWRGTPSPPGRWTLLHLRPAPGFVGAVALRSAPAEVRTWSWNGSPSDSS